MSDDMVSNLKKPSAWFRVLFMAGFVIALYVTGIILLVLMLAQVIFSLLTGEDNINLRRLGAGLSSYVNQILSYLTYNSEQKPFPFLPFPLAPMPQDSGSSESDNSESAATQSSKSGSSEQTQMAAADDDGFQHASEPSDNVGPDSQASDTQAAADVTAAAAQRSTGRKKKSTDPEAPQTDD
ncbi:MAG: DUF4389 domain-containing protein [Gammaproteobacteria bacterium]|nr:DUF4389 domain-containing protein [Gammaproteobacteria bacterium]